MSRPARDIASESTTRPIRTPARRARHRSRLGLVAKPEPQPTITRLIGDAELVPPPGCGASLLLKQVGQGDGHRYFSWWLVVGRSAADALSVPYKHSGGDTFRIDVPEGMPLSAADLQPYLTAFWEKQQPPGADDPPIIKG